MFADPYMAGLRLMCPCLPAKPPSGKNFNNCLNLRKFSGVLGLDFLGSRTLDSSDLCFSKRHSAGHSFSSVIGNSSMLHLSWTSYTLRKREKCDIPAAGDGGVMQGAQGNHGKLFY